MAGHNVNLRRHQRSAGSRLLRQTVTDIYFPLAALYVLRGSHRSDLFHSSTTGPCHCNHGGLFPASQLAAVGPRTSAGVTPTWFVLDALCRAGAVLPFEDRLFSRVLQTFPQDCH